MTKVNSTCKSRNGNCFRALKRDKNTFFVVQSSTMVIPPTPQPPFFTFKTKQSGNVDFNIIKSSQAANTIWYMGDGTIIAGSTSVNHTYADSSEKTVSIHVGNYDLVTGLGDFSGKNITYFDARDLNNLSGTLEFDGNPELTEWLQPATFAGEFLEINFDGCDLQHSLDFSTTTARGRVSANGNINLPGFTHPVYSGTTTVDFRGCTTIPEASFTCSPNYRTISAQYEGCTSLQSFQPLNIAFRTCNLADTDITGVLDLSTCRMAVSVGCFWLTNAVNCTGINWKVGDQNVGRFIEANNFRGFVIMNTSISILDLSGFTGFSFQRGGAIVNDRGIEDNPLLTEIIFQTAPSANNSSPKITNNSILGSIDFKGLRFNPNNAVFVSENNLTEILKTVDAGKCTRFSASDNPNLEYFPTAHFIDYDTDGSHLNNSEFVFINCDLSAEEVNHFLVDMDANSTSQTHTRGIDFSGINAAPDAVSGGFDGLAAKASLIAKGFTVTTN